MRSARQSCGATAASTPDTRAKAEPAQKAPVLAVQGVSWTGAGPGFLSRWAGCFLLTVEVTHLTSLKVRGCVSVVL